MHLRESWMRENCTSSLGGGRRLARERASSGPTPTNVANNHATFKMVSAEQREERRAAKGNAGQTPAPRTQNRIRASMGLDGVREAARKSKELRFTTLMHHITP